MSRLPQRRAQSLAEYGLLLGLVAVLVIAAVVLFRDELSGVFSNVNDNLAAGPAAPGGEDPSNPAEFTVTDPDPTAGEPIQFVGPDAADWAWDFDADGITDDTTQSPTHAFDEGDHAVTLAINGGADEFTTTISVGPSAGPPVAAFDFDPVRPTQTDPMLTNCSWGWCMSGEDLVFHRLLSGTTVLLDNNSTGTISSYLWEVRPQTTVVWQTLSTEANPAFTPTIHTNYMVRLTVSGPGGATDTETLNLGEVRDPLQGYIADADLGLGSSVNGKTKTSAQYWKLSFQPGGPWASTSFNQTVTCSWDRGGGLPVVVTNNNNFNAPEVTLPNYRYPSPGTYSVSVTCSDWTGDYFTSVTITQS